MSLNASMSCDNCEKVLALPYDDGDREEMLDRVEASESGWFVLSLPTALEDDPGDFDADSDVHLCSERCLTVWAATRAVLRGTVDVG